MPEQPASPSGAASPLDDASVPHLSVEFEWTRIDGRDEPVTITIRSADGMPLRSNDLRIPFHQLAAADLARRQGRDRPPVPIDGLPPHVRDAIERHTFTNPADRVAVAAEVYQLATANHVQPTRAVAEHLEVSRSAAAKIVATARTRGLLPPTTRGRPRANPSAESMP